MSDRIFSKPYVTKESRDRFDRIFKLEEEATMKCDKCGWNGDVFECMIDDLRTINGFEFLCPKCESSVERNI